jgi:hypothetical protein
MSPRWFICLAGFLLWADLASAQVEMTFRLPNHEVLELEAVPALVTMLNRGSQPLQKGADYDLAFDINDASGVQIRKRPNQGLVIPEQLPPGQSITVTNDLALTYQIGRQGPYTVVARLKLAQRALVSGREYLDVMPGAEVAMAEGVSKDGAARRYSLRQLSRKNISRLYLRVDDPEASLCYGVVDLGRVIPLRAPSLQVDGHGLIHALHMTGPVQFIHSVFSPDGELVAQQTHSGDANAVRLQPDPEAGFRVEGTGVSKPRDPFIETLPGRKHL